MLLDLLENQVESFLIGSYDWLRFKTYLQFEVFPHHFFGIVHLLFGFIGVPSFQVTDDEGFSSVLSIYYILVCIEMYYVIRVGIITPECGVDVNMSDIPVI